MRFRIDVVRKDENGKEFSRSTVGEFPTEEDAFKEMKKQENVLRTMGSDDTCVEMIRLF